MTPGKVSYSLPATTFKRDNGYSFQIWANYSGSDCKYGRVVNWSHDGDRLDGGPQTCAAAPMLDVFYPRRHRFWHEQGVDDADPQCIHGGPDFDPSMPTGWLATVSYNGWDEYVKTDRVYDTAPGVPSCTDDDEHPSGVGVEPIFWRSPPGYDEYVCMWTQYAPYGDLPLPDGWFHGVPWTTQRPGDIRDVYLKLDTIDYDALLEQHAPVLAFDADENFYPQEAGAFTDFADPPPGGYVLSSEYANILYDGNGEEIAAAGSPGPGNGPWPPIMVLGALGSSYWFGPDPEDQPAAAGTDYIDARGSSESTYSADAATQHAAGYDGVVYGRVVHDPDDGALWLQYWVFYYFNSFDVLGVGHHEGDWEMVQVGLTPHGTPEKMTFAAHTYAYGLNWSEVSKVGLGGTHPVVYVAARSHASYPEAGETSVDLPLLPDPTDHHGGDAVWQTLPIDEWSSAIGWPTWPGRWGASLSGSTPSPVGPSGQGDKWARPSTFHDAAREW